MPSKSQIEANRPDPRPPTPSATVLPRKDAGALATRIRERPSPGDQPNASFQKWYTPDRQDDTVRREILGHALADIGSSVADPESAPVARPDESIVNPASPQPMNSAISSERSQLLAPRPEAAASAPRPELTERSQLLANRPDAGASAPRLHHPSPKAPRPADTPSAYPLPPSADASRLHHPSPKAPRPADFPSVYPLPPSVDAPRLHPPRPAPHGAILAAQRRTGAGDACPFNPIPNPLTAA